MSVFKLKTMGEFCKVYLGVGLPLFLLLLRVNCELRRESGITTGIGNLAELDAPVPTKSISKVADPDIVEAAPSSEKPACVNCNGGEERSNVLPSGEEVDVLFDPNSPDRVGVIYKSGLPSHGSSFLSTEDADSQADKKVKPRTSNAFRPTEWVRGREDPETSYVDVFELPSTALSAEQSAGRVLISRHVPPAPPS